MVIIVLDSESLMPILSAVLSKKNVSITRSAMPDEYLYINESASLRKRKKRMLN